MVTDSYGGSVRVLVLWADDRSPNLGVRALGAGSRALIASVWPEADVVNHNFGSRVTPVPMGSVRAAAKELATGSGGVVDWLADFDLVLDTRSGDSFADIYGLRRLTIMHLMAEAVRRSGTPMVIAPQTIGPFTTRRGRILAKRALGMAQIVFARDSDSAARAAALGRPVDRVVTDVVFALPQPGIGVRRDVIMNVSGLLWSTDAHGRSEDYRRTVVQVIRGLQESGRAVTLMPHVLAGDPRDNDEAVLPDVIAAVGTPLDVVVPTSLADARSIVAGARLTIGSRMHACLNSLSTGVPAIPMAYSDKFTPLLADIGWHDVVDLRASSGSAAAVLEYAADPSLSDRAAAVRTAADRGIDEAREALRSLTPQADHRAR